jgi:hypothetical protein
MALDGRVLLLNQTYEPLGTVSVARAVIMTFKDTVTVEEYEASECCGLYERNFACRP